MLNSTAVVEQKPAPAAADLVNLVAVEQQLSQQMEQMFQAFTEIHQRGLEVRSSMEGTDLAAYAAS